MTQLKQFEMEVTNVHEKTRLAIQADRDVCIGSGMCILYAPQVFSQDDECKVVVRNVPDSDVETVRIAVDACPTGALRMVEHDAG